MVTSDLHRPARVATEAVPAWPLLGGCPQARGLGETGWAEMQGPWQAAGWVQGGAQSRGLGCGRSLPNLTLVTFFLKPKRVRKWH